jgi:hypothetical protein
MNKLRLLTLAGTAALTLAACGNPTPTPVVITEVNLTGANTTKVGTPTPLKVVVKGTGAYDKGVTLSADKGTIASSASEGDTVNYSAPATTTATSAVINIVSKGNSTVKANFNMAITPNVTGLVINGGTEVASEGSITLSAAVTGGDSSQVNWVVTGGTPATGTGSTITIKAPKLAEGAANGSITVKATSAQDGNATQNATIVVKAPPITTGDLAGTVSDDAGALTGVKVSLSNGSDATTAGDGKYSFPKLSSGLYSLSFTKAGYDSQNTFATIEAGKVTTRNITLVKTAPPPPPPTGDIAGTVTDSATGLVLADVSVLGPTGVVKTAADGKFSFTKVNTGSYTLSYTKAGYVAKDKIVTVVKDGTANANVALDVTPITQGAAPAGSRLSVIINDEFCYPYVISADKLSCTTTLVDALMPGTKTIGHVGTATANGQPDYNADGSINNTTKQTLYSAFNQTFEQHPWTFKAVGPDGAPLKNVRILLKSILGAGASELVGPGSILTDDNGLATVRLYGNNPAGGTTRLLAALVNNDPNQSEVHKLFVDKTFYNQAHLRFFNGSRSTTTMFNASVIDDSGKTNVAPDGGVYTRYNNAFSRTYKTTFEAFDTLTGNGIPLFQRNYETFNTGLYNQDAAGLTGLPRDLVTGETVTYSIVDSKLTAINLTSNSVNYGAAIKPRLVVGNGKAVLTSAGAGSDSSVSINGVATVANQNVTFFLPQPAVGTTTIRVDYFKNGRLLKNYFIKRTFKAAGFALEKFGPNVMTWLGNRTTTSDMNGGITNISVTPTLGRTGGGSPQGLVPQARFNLTKASSFRTLDGKGGALKDVSAVFDESSGRYRYYITVGNTAFGDFAADAENVVVVEDLPVELNVANAGVVVEGSTTCPTGTAAPVVDGAGVSKPSGFDNAADCASYQPASDNGQVATYDAYNHRITWQRTVVGTTSKFFQFPVTLAPGEFRTVWVDVFPRHKPGYRFAAPEFGQGEGGLNTLQRSKAVRTRDVQPYSDPYVFINAARAVADGITVLETAQEIYVTRPILSLTKQNVGPFSLGVSASEPFRFQINAANVNRNQDRNSGFADNRARGGLDYRSNNLVLPLGTKGTFGLVGSIDLIATNSQVGFVNAAASRLGGDLTYQQLVTTFGPETVVHPLAKAVEVRDRVTNGLDYVRSLHVDKDGNAQALSQAGTYNDPSRAIAIPVGDLIYNKGVNAYKQYFGSSDPGSVARFNIQLQKVRPGYFENCAALSADNINQPYNVGGTSYAQFNQFGVYVAKSENGRNYKDWGETNPNFGGDDAFGQDPAWNQKIGGTPATFNIAGTNIDRTNDLFTSGQFYIGTVTTLNDLTQAEVVGNLTKNAQDPANASYDKSLYENRNFGHSGVSFSNINNANNVGCVYVHVPGINPGTVPAFGGLTGDHDPDVRPIAGPAALRTIATDLADLNNEAPAVNVAFADLNDYQGFKRADLAGVGGQVFGNVAADEFALTRTFEYSNIWRNEGIGDGINVNITSTQPKSGAISLTLPVSINILYVQNATNSDPANKPTVLAKLTGTSTTVLPGGRGTLAITVNADGSYSINTPVMKPRDEIVIEQVVRAAGVGTGNFTTTLTADNFTASPVVRNESTTVKTTVIPSTISITPGLGFANNVTPIGGAGNINILGSNFLTASSVNFTCDTAPMAVTYLPDAGGAFIAGEFQVLNNAEIVVKPLAHAPGVCTVTVTTAAGTASVKKIGAQAFGNTFVYVNIPPNTAFANNALLSLSPVAGPVTGGTAVTVTTSNFLPIVPANAGLQVKLFVDDVLVPYTITGNNINFTTPAHAAGTVVVDVDVCNAENECLTTNGLSFTYFGGPTITSLVPNNGPAVGGTVVTMTGTNFYAPMTVSVATLPAAVAPAVTINSTTSATFTIPAGNYVAGSYNVTATTNSGSVTLPSGYTINQPAITAVTPNNGPANGGNGPVVITGSNFTGATSVVFGTGAGNGGFTLAPANFTVNGAGTTVTLTVPAGVYTPADVNVTVNVGTLTSTTLVNGYSFNGPLVSAIVPSNGPATGNTAVTITGIGFTGSTQATVAGVVLTTFVVVNDTTITGLIPAGQNFTAGQKDVAVTTLAGVATLVNGYTVNSPSITTVTPNNGPAVGGTAVTITGTNFTGATSAVIGATTLTSFTVVNGTTITGTIPAGNYAAGAVNVTVNIGTNVSTTLVNGYTFNAPTFTSIDNTSIGSLTSIEPFGLATGPAYGIKIVGTNLTGTTQVVIGTGTAPGGVTVAITPVDVNLAGTQITFMLPAGPYNLGPKNVVISVGSGTGANVTVVNGFTFINGPTITGIGVMYPTPHGSDFVSRADGVAQTISQVGGKNSYSRVIKGKYFVDNTVTVTVGTLLTAYVCDSVQIAGASDGDDLCFIAQWPTLPLFDPNVSPNITVTTPVGSVVGNPFTYIRYFSLTNLAPNNGPVAGGNSVTINGTQIGLPAGYRADARVNVGNPGVVSKNGPAGSPFTLGAFSPWPSAAQANTTSGSTVQTQVRWVRADSNGITDTLGGVEEMNSLNTLGYTYNNALPTCTAIVPPTITVLGGVVNLVGTGFVPGTTVTVNAVAAGIVINSTTSITLTVPALAAGSYPVVVTVPAPGGGVANCPMITTVAAPAAGVFTSIQGVFWSNSPLGVRAGELVTVTGSGAGSFVPGAVTVTVVGQFPLSTIMLIGAQVTTLSDTTITFPMPSLGGTSGNFAVTVSNGVDTRTTVPTTYDYRAGVPQVSTCAVTTFPGLAGPFTFAITGTSLTSTSLVTLQPSNISVPFTVTNDTAVSAGIVNVPGGTTSITITTGSGPCVVNFPVTVPAPFVCSSINPNPMVAGVGPYALNVVGSGFTGMLTLGGSETGTAVVSNANLATVAIPGPLTAGLKTIVLTNTIGNTCSIQFTVNPS